MKTLKLLPLFFALFAVGCSPYQINALAQAASQAANSQQEYYNQQVQISQRYGQSLQKQQEINAYNERTRALSQPQQLNLNHSGTINHNVYGY